MPRKIRSTPGVVWKPSGRPIPGMPAPGKVVTVDIRDMPAWREKNHARVIEYERRGWYIIGWVEESTDGE